jgi:hypothetical protein
MEMVSCLKQLAIWKSPLLGSEAITFAPGKGTESWFSRLLSPQGFPEPEVLRDRV